MTPTLFHFKKLPVRKTMAPDTLSTSSRRRGYRTKIASQRDQLLSSVDDALNGALPPSETSDIDAEARFEEIFQSFLAAANDNTDFVIEPDAPTNHASEPLSAPKTDEHFKHITISDEFRAEIEQMLNEKDFMRLKRETRHRPLETVNALYELLADRIKRGLSTSMPVDIVEDYVQYAFTRLIETTNKTNGWSGEGSIEAWLVRVAKNAFIERQRSKEMTFSDYDFDDGESTNNEASAWEDRVATHQGDYPWVENGFGGDQTMLEEHLNVRMTYKKVVEVLKPEQMQILHLLLQGYRADEIARTLEVPASRIQSIQRELQDIFKRALDGEDISDLIDEE